MNEVEQERRLQEELAEIKKNHSIKPGGPEMEAFLSAGYPDIATREHAKEILDQRKANPALIPWEMEQKAKAFLAALDASPIVIDKKPSPKMGHPVTR